jgi:flagella basal body P-ring formation protein FlgA
MMWRIVLCFLASPAVADSVVATRAIPANAIIRAEDVTMVDMQIPDAASALADVIGKSPVIAISAGRAVPADQLHTPLRIERNAMVPLVLKSGGLEIRTEGRTLSQGGVGDVIEIMNANSRARLSGTIREDGSVLVSSNP